MSVAEARQRINAREFGEWIAYGNVEPFGPERLEVAIGLAAMRLCECWGVKNPKVEDFMPSFEPPKPQSDEEIQRTVEAFIAQQEAKRRG